MEAHTSFLRAFVDMALDNHEAVLRHQLDQLDENCLRQFKVDDVEEVKPVQKQAPV